MSVSDDHYKIRAVRANDDSPCPGGCIVVEYKDDTQVLGGDCRAPGNDWCWLNKKEKEDE